MRRKLSGCRFMASPRCRLAAFPARLRDYVKRAAPFDDLVRTQPQAAVAGAFAGADVVFIAMPGAHEVRLVGGEGLSEPGLVGRQHIFDLGHDDTFATGPALMQAQ